LNFYDWKLSMADRVRVGVVGTSWFAATLHLASLASHPEAELTALCGRNRERADSVAADHNSPMCTPTTGK